MDDDHPCFNIFYIRNIYILLAKKTIIFHTQNIRKYELYELYFITPIPKLKNKNLLLTGNKLHQN